MENNYRKHDRIAFIGFVIVLTALTLWAIWVYLSHKVCTVDEFPCEPDNAPKHERPKHNEQPVYPDHQCEGNQCLKG
jgi:hypothetical protein